MIGESLADDVANFCQGKFLVLPQSTSVVTKFLFLDGILLFNHEGIYDACDLRFFLTLNKETCHERRQLRRYDPPDPPGYFDRVVWPYYIKNLAEIHYKRKAHEEEITYLVGEGTLEDNFLKVMCKVLAVPL